MNAKDLKKEFISPSVAYRGKPFWAWNGELRGEELTRQAGIMKQMGLGGYFMHSRTGLITEYLGDEWFDLINEVADVAERDGMEAWLYDEDRWPSGSAGGKVTVDPQYRMKSMYVYEIPCDRYEPFDDTYSLYVAKIDGINMWAYREIDKNATDVAVAIEAVKKELDADDLPGEWKLLRFAIVPDPCHSNYNGTTYIDTMSLKATEKFIEMTHEEYVRRCGKRIGTSIKGIFTDEPHRGKCLDNKREQDGVISCAMCWTDDLFDEFEKRYGYDARPILPELYYRYKGEKVARVKLHYIDLANNLFIERFAMPINAWCKAHNLIFTGHVLHENTLMNQTVPNGSLMRFYEHMGYPGVDVLTEHCHAYWIVKQLSSAARQLGKKWLLSELYGCTGWQFNFKSHKAVGDWQALFGINVRCQHLSWYTMEGESKRDYPASILHQSPWYADYAKVEDYFARFGLVMSEGKPACDVLLLNPIESVWCQAYMGWASWIRNLSPDVTPYESRYAQLFHILTGNQIDFDYGEEQMMAQMAAVEQDGQGNAVLRVGEQRYRVVIVGNMLTIRPSTLSLLERFIALGGKVIFAGDVPGYVDAVASSAPAALSARGICVPFEEAAIVSAVRESSNEYVSVTDADGKTDTAVFVQVRKEFGENGCAFVLLNTDREQAKKDLTVAIKVPNGQAIEEWDLETGERLAIEKSAFWQNGTLFLTTSLEAAGTRCFVITSERDEALVPAKAFETVSEALAVIDGEFDFSKNEENVCVLDFVKWRLQGGAFSEEIEVLKADRAVRDTVGIERRGGEMLQPWFAKKNDAKAYGELEIVYEFEIETLPCGDVYLAGERPELNHYTINGVALSNHDVNDFWIDECLKRMKIPSGALKIGKNVVTATPTFMRTTNLEALYLIGDFGVSIEGHKCTLTQSPKRIGCKNLEEYGLPFYTGSITYHLTAQQYAGQIDLSAGERVVLSPISHTGGCVKVTALGKTKVLGWDPYEADVTDAVRVGAPIDVTVVGTRKNLFGPLHQLPKIASSCGPGSFVTRGEKWTDDYALIDSGLRGIALKVQKEKLL